MATRQTSSKLLLVCSILPAVLPVFHWWPILARLDSVIAATTFSQALRSNMRQVAIGQLVLSFAVAFALGLLLCSAINFRLIKQRSMGLRVVVDLAVLAGFFLAPWLAPKALFGSSTIGLLELWSDVGAAQLPCLSGLLAGASFWLAKRLTLVQPQIGAA